MPKQKIFQEQEYSDDGKTVLGRHILAISNNNIPDVGEMGTLKFEVRVPLLCAESVIGLACLKEADIKMSQGTAYHMTNLFCIDGPPCYKVIHDVGQSTQFNPQIPLQIPQLLMYYPSLHEVPDDAKGLRAFFGRKQKEAKPIHDFDEEAKKLYARLNLPDPTVRQDKFVAHDVPDCVWVHPNTGAKLYIGNIGSAQNLNVLN